MTSLSFLVNCQPKNKDKFEWNAGISAPKNYIAGGPFVEYFYKGKSVAGTSSGVGINPGWGTTSGGYTGGDKFKPIPDSLSVSWRCGSDLVGYKTSFKLPEEKMKEFFEKNIKNADGSTDSYRTIVTGMAPGGNVSVWIKGGNQTVEIIKSKAKKNKETNKNDPSSVTLWTSTGSEAKDILTYFYLHGIPYDVWEKDEPTYNYDIGILDSTNSINPSITNIYTKSGRVFQYFTDLGSNYSMDIISNDKNSSLLNNNKTKKEQLPVQIYLKWKKKGSLTDYYRSIIVMPHNLEVYLSNGNNRFIIQILPNNFGELKLINENGTQDLMKFIFEEFSDSNYTPKYSLPKNYQFPKWGGRIPLDKPTDFDYWQEQ